MRRLWMLLALWPAALAAQVSGSINLTVEQPPPEPPADLIWTGPTTGAVGDTLRISYEVVDASGNPTEGVTAWSVSDGTKAALLVVTDSTLAVELLAPGAVRLDYVVTAPGGGPDPIPPPDGAGYATDPPQGYTLATRNTFDGTLHAPGWTGRTECCGDAPWSFLTMESGATPEAGGGTFARFTFTTDYTDGAGTAHLNYLALDERAMFVRAWVRLVNWTWHPSGVNKFGYVQIHEAPCPGSRRPWILNIEGNAEPGRVGYVGQCDSALTTRINSPTSGPYVRTGEWTEIAYWVVGSTGPDGHLSAWIGGDLVIDLDRQTMPAGYPVRIEGFHGAPIWGGRFQTVPATMYMDVAAIEIWTPGA